MHAHAERPKPIGKAVTQKRSLIQLNNILIDGCLGVRYMHRFRTLFTSSSMKSGHLHVLKEIYNEIATAVEKVDEKDE